MAIFGSFSKATTMGSTMHSKSACMVTTSSATATQVILATWERRFVIWAKGQGTTRGVQRMRDGT